MALEKLGSWEDQCSKNGSRFGNHFRGREKTKKEATTRLSLRKSEKPQLLGLQILFLRVPCIAQCPR